MQSANKAFYEKFWVTEKQTDGHSLFELGHEQWEIPKLRQQLEKILPKKTSFENFEVRHEFPNIGRRIMILNAREVIRDEGGEKLILLAFEDITEKKIAEKNLELSEIKFKLLVQTIPQLIWVSYPDGRINYFNAQWDKYIGSNSAKSLDEQWVSHIHPEDRPEVSKKWKQSLETGDLFNMEYRLKGADGKYLWFLANALPVHNAEGEIIQWFGSHTDIQHQKEAEIALRKSGENLRQLADAIPEKVSHADENGNKTYFNQDCQEYTGISQQELIIKGWTTLVHPEDKKTVLQKWAHSIKTEEDFEAEIRLKNKNNEHKWHLKRATAIKDDEGDIKLWIAVTTEIQKIKDEEKRKQDFLKMVSHELKTPVTSIKGYVQLLLRLQEKNKKQKLESLPLGFSLERIDHQVNRLARLIHEMLDLTRIEEERLELKREVFNINKLVNETVQDINYTNTDHKIKIQHEVECNVKGDKDRIGQVLINFITNAIKYSPDKKDIEIRVFQSKKGQVTVSVKDQGIGIAKKDLKKIFQRFYRVEGKNQETFGGFGIGLFLSNEIIERHNGSVTVESKLGEGSVFGFTLGQV